MNSCHYCNFLCSFQFFFLSPYILFSMFFFFTSSFLNSYSFYISSISISFHLPLLLLFFHSFLTTCSLLHLLPSSFPPHLPSTFLTSSVHTSSCLPLLSLSLFLPHFPYLLPSFQISCLTSLLHFIPSFYASSPFKHCLCALLFPNRRCTQA